MYGLPPSTILSYDIVTAVIFFVQVSDSPTLYVLWRFYEDYEGSTICSRRRTSKRYDMYRSFCPAVLLLLMVDICSSSCNCNNSNILRGFVDNLPDHSTSQRAADVVLRCASIPRHASAIRNLYFDRTRDLLGQHVNL